MKNAPRMSDSDIEKAVRLLDAWTNKLTWDRYLAVLEIEIGHRYSKVAIHKGQPRIMDAWNRAKARLKSAVDQAGVTNFGDAAIAELHRKIGELKARNARLEQENRDLLEQFRLWSFNAVAFGLSQEMLSRPLPPVSRNNGNL